MSENNDFLLSCDLEGGCSAKIPPDLLEQTLAPILNQKIDGNLMSDIDIGDDAGVYKINDELALIYTLDFFPTVVEDPYEFGQIAATNSISDVYAMGGTPKLALNITMFPKEYNLEILARMLKGGQDKATEANCLIIGGHTITDKSVKYGLSVVGFANPKDITANSNAREGDVLILTKAIGTGTSLAAFRQKLVERVEIEDVFISMKTLNNKAARIMNKYKVVAATDITGFGLIGHAHKMAEASNVSIEINTRSIPLFENAYRIMDMGCITAAAFTNMRYVGSKAKFEDTLDYNYKMLACDPQTSGGILMCVKEEDSNNILADLWREGLDCSSIIGQVLKRSEYSVILK